MTDENSFSHNELSSAIQLQPSISGADEAARFTQHCVDYYQRWFASSSYRINSIPPDQAALFVYTQAPDVAPGITEIKVSDLKRAHINTLSVESGVVVCNENLRSSFRVPVALTSSDEIMDFVLNSMNADQTFVIMLMTKQKLLVHHAGVQIGEWYDNPLTVNVSSVDNVVSLESVDEQLKIYHDDHTSTPRACTARLMWKTDGNKPKLSHMPELHVQTTLLTHLKAWYKQVNVIVQEEVPNSGGRVDIQISRATAGKMVKSTLELKVLKPEKSDNWNRDWGLEGIQQAKRYINHETDFSMACLFDARLDKTDALPALQPSADAAGVHLRRFPMDPPKSKEPKAIKPDAAAPDSTS
ncbi:hypothetical protein [Pseudomonas citronellolis]|uniref:hypothetical protein n=1 Tax=Pseudomonas citronellolis TaxID=53408 RepID=UPI0023E476A1|nr:hypothetical protein [Pseudomonas citronellolis]MDF3932219.1 hypothetical protein [Pseudomonas citronellolis]